MMEGRDPKFKREVLSTQEEKRYSAAISAALAPEDAQPPTYQLQVTKIIHLRVIYKIERTRIALLVRKMNRILVKKEFAPGINLVLISAPEIAKKARPGQFVIIKVDEKGERFPFSFVDCNPEMEYAFN